MFVLAANNHVDFTGIGIDVSDIYITYLDELVVDPAKIFSQNITYVSLLALYPTEFGFDYFPFQTNLCPPLCHLWKYW